MRDPHQMRLIPKEPGVYCLYGYSARRSYPAYVGIGKNLRSRISQHLEYRDSSVVTGASTVSLDPDQVSEARWWTHPNFNNDLKLRAAELVAFETLKPTLQSRAGIGPEAQKLAQEDQFKTEMTSLFQSTPNGTAHFPGIIEYGNIIRKLEARVKALEAELTELRRKLA